MTLKGSGDADQWEEIDRFDRGVGWLPYPSETMQRASHLMESDGEVWLIDPIDVDGLDDLIAEFGEVAGVVILLDRHKRDCAELANRHDVSVWVPGFMDDVVEELDASINRFDNALGDSGFQLHKVVDNSFWQEGMLYNDETGVMVVSESVGNTGYFKTGDRALGVHPMRRFTPPRILTEFDPDRIHLGHGTGVHENATAELERAVNGAMVRMPHLYAKNFKNLIFG